VIAPAAVVLDRRLVHQETTVAETLPRVYRRVLDAVARLGELGERREAGRLRAAAIEAYSGAWNTRTHRRLEEIVARAEALVEERERLTTPRVA
jgi:hypothetical protein